jgi:hypothetical protein
MINRSTVKCTGNRSKCTVLMIFCTLRTYIYLRKQYARNKINVYITLRLSESDLSDIEKVRVLFPFRSYVNCLCPGWSITRNGKFINCFGSGNKTVLWWTSLGSFRTGEKKTNSQKAPPSNNFLFYFIDRKLDTGGLLRSSVFLSNIWNDRKNRKRKWK